MMHGWQNVTYVCLKCLKTQRYNTYTKPMSDEILCSECKNEMTFVSHRLRIPKRDPKKWEKFSKRFLLNK
jgi:hypothetical protein